MKATLAMLACLSMAGFLSAAAVTGNNTAVVIQKKAVKANGWQFICVPVNKLSITGQTTGTISAAELLPVDLYDVQTQIYTVDESGASKLACTLAQTTVEGEETVKAWVAAADDPDTDENEAGTTEFNPGAILWVKDTSSIVIPTALTALLGETSTEGTEEAETIVFCGQDRGTYTPGTPNTAKGSLTPMKNDSSSAITLAQATSSTPTAGDKILVLEAGRSEYKQYVYGVPRNQNVAAGWWDEATGLRADSVTIAAGEAYFYLTR